MGIPQWIVIMLYGLNVLSSFMHHGEPYRVNNNFWISLAGAAVLICLLGWGGFWG